MREEESAEEDIIPDLLPHFKFTGAKKSKTIILPKDTVFDQTKPQFI